MLQRNIGTSETKLSYQIRKVLPQLESNKAPCWNGKSMGWPVRSSNMIFSDFGDALECIVEPPGRRDGYCSLAWAQLRRQDGSGADGTECRRTSYRPKQRWWSAIRSGMARRITVCCGKKSPRYGVSTDELGSHNSKNFDGTIYAPSNGKTKRKVKRVGMRKEDPEDSAIPPYYPIHW